MVELCQRLTSEEDEEEYEVREKVEMEVASRGKETLLHFGSSLGLCRLVKLYPDHRKKVSLFLCRSAPCSTGRLSILVDVWEKRAMPWLGTERAAPLW